MKRHAIRALLAALVLPCAGAWAAGDAAAQLPLAGDRLYGLPPEAAARQALAALPALRAGGINRELAGAERERLAAGPYEWIASAGLARRSIRGSGERFREEEAGLERTVRWFGKAGQDRAIGDQGVALAESQRADLWHEAGRALMRDWYAALTAHAAELRLAQQHALVERLRQVAERRVKAGDGAALELMQADTELRRSGALLEQARLDAVQASSLLAATYAALPAPDAHALPEPQALDALAQVDLPRLMDDNHELALARAESAWEELRARRASSERMPDPTIGVRVARERAGEERLVGLSLSMPIPGALRSAESRAAVLRAGMAQERVEQTRVRVEVDARRALAEQAHRHRLWIELRDVAAQSARQADLMERAYQAGETTLADGLLARRMALDAALSAQTAQIAALAAAARVQLDAHALWRAE
ncbi:TolC family protein [Telluria beijingensis]|uniref:TolC family protein n=1 Tax=Telluria beijingensis TaxID=3068633 RepID=UPI002795291D|nr:TolC family protein [Massilia sp. REN29]